MKWALICLVAVLLISGCVSDEYGLRVAVDSGPRPFTGTNESFTGYLGEAPPRINISEKLANLTGDEEPFVPTPEDMEGGTAEPVVCETYILAGVAVIGDEMTLRAACPRQSIDYVYAIETLMQEFRVETLADVETTLTGMADSEFTGFLNKGLHESSGPAA